MTAQCSLDDFIIHNTQEIRVSPGTPGVSFGSYSVPAGGLFDATLLWNKGYRLEASGEKINLSGFGSADILDKEGQKTGYRLVSHGGGNLEDGSYHSSYYLEDEMETRGTDKQRFNRVRYAHKTWRREQEIRTARQKVSSFAW